MPSLQKQKNPKSSTSINTSKVVDPRFAAFASNSRFRFPSKKNNKIKLDKRFSQILNDDGFTNQASVDRYGRKISKNHGKQRLKRLYHVESDDNDEDDGKQTEDEDEDEEEDKEDRESGEEDDTVLKELKKANQLHDPARTGGFSSSSSDDSDFDSDSDAATDATGELPAESAPVPLGNPSRRLAIVNLDWDNVRAQDLFAVAASFCPPAGGGSVVAVAVYPSEFGRERMEREDIQGPPREVFAAPTATAAAVSRVETDSHLNLDVDKDMKPADRLRLGKDQTDEGAEFDSVALRKYQLDRLRYYYAVVECSSEAVGKALYDAMDGQEYLSSANFFDLRFIPDEVTFDEKPRDSCKSMPSDYRPTDFTTDALMHSKVKLTWDADDTRRKDIQKRAFSRDELNEQDLLAYIGSNSSSEDDSEFEEELKSNNHNDNSNDNGNESENDGLSVISKATTRQARRDALREALGLDLKPSKSSRKDKDKNPINPVGGMQITFTPALSKQKEGASVFENQPEETTAEKYVRKERERKLKRKEQAKLKRAEHDGVDHPEEENEDEENENISNDKGFDDPFFDDPDATNKASKLSRKAKKIKSLKQKQEQEKTNNLNSKQQAELELLIMDQDGKDSTGIKNHNNDDDNEVEVNVHDPRTQSFYTDPDFAIDPTSHLFKESKGSRTILEEKRKRGEKRDRQRISSTSSKAKNVDDLIEKVKKKAKKW